jgi:hypothetical protein
MHLSESLEAFFQRATDEGEFIVGGRPWLEFRGDASLRESFDFRS